jgi:hypothetical protein
VKKFVILSYGFETPTPEIMQAWGKWFESIKDHIVEMARLKDGREISRAGATDLPLGPDSITGYIIVEAASRDDAEQMAARNPYVSSIRVYEALTK